VIRSESKRILDRKKQSENQKVDVDRIRYLINQVTVYGNRTGVYGQLEQWVSQVIVAQNLSAQGADMEYWIIEPHDSVIISRRSSN
jgi:hypothetical protein